MADSGRAKALRRESRDIITGQLDRLESSVMDMHSLANQIRSDPDGYDMGTLTMAASVLRRLETTLTGTHELIERVRVDKLQHRVSQLESMVVSWLPAQHTPIYAPEGE